MPSLPPLEPLREVARRLDTAGISWALGGSALLHAIGLADTVRDWDLTTEASPDDAYAALRDLEPTRHGNFGIHADHKVVCFGDAVEVICRFAFFAPDSADPARVIHIPTIVTGTWNGFPIGSPAAWAVAYTLMAGEKLGRAEKAAALFEWIEKHGADVKAQQSLLGEPLPADLVARVRRLKPGIT